MTPIGRSTDIARLIDTSALSQTGKDRARALFRRLAEVEAAIHQVPLDQVHLHEVGAIDSIIDIVGVVFAMEWFGIDDVVAAPLNVGGGTIRIAHGTYPVPAPATLKLLTGVPIYNGGPDMELVTPTGALLVTGYARAFGPDAADVHDRGRLRRGHARSAGATQRAAGAGGRPRGCGRDGPSAGSAGPAPSCRSTARSTT